MLNKLIVNRIIMKHTYTVTGMTCNNCKASVEEKLSKINNINNVEVNLEKKEAVITMQQHVSLSTLQEALPSKYTIVEKNVFASTEVEQEKSKLQQLFPLFLILSYVFIASILLNNSPWNTQGFMLDFMGLFYIVFSFFKLLDLKGFATTFSMYDPLAKAMPSYGYVYPFIEVALGLFFLFRFQIDVALWVTLVVLGITTVGVTQTLVNKKKIQCACLGTALKLPMTEATFIENAIMLIMAVFMIAKTFN